jgi:hypothetical protein
MPVKSPLSGNLKTQPFNGRKRRQCYSNFIRQPIWQYHLNSATIFFVEQKPFQIIPKNYLCQSNLTMMVFTIKKGMEKKSLNEALLKIKPVKKINAKLHLGKVKWHEDALTYQKRLRDECD